MHESVAYSIGQQKRFQVCTEGPGVGKYDLTKWTPISKARRVPSAIITNTKRDPTSTELSPGPGSYEIPRNSIRTDTHRPILIGKPKDLTNQGSPGPGTYEVPKADQTRFKSNPRFSFSSASLQKSGSKIRNPGPSDYDISDSQKSLSRGYVFGKERKYQKNPSITPGPGVYENITTILKSACKYSFSKEKKYTEASRWQAYKACIPGPGAYETLTTRRIKCSNFFKNSLQKADSQAAGAYNLSYISSFRSPQVKIGSSTRQTIEHHGVSQTPGPGVHPDTKSKQSSSSRTMFNRHIKDVRLKTDQQSPRDGLNFHSSSATHRTKNSSRQPAMFRKSRQNIQVSQVVNKVRKRVASAITELKAKPPIQSVTSQKQNDPKHWPCDKPPKPKPQKSFEQSYNLYGEGQTRQGILTEKNNSVIFV